MAIPAPSTIISKTTPCSELCAENGGIETLRGFAADAYPKIEAAYHSDQRDVKIDRVCSHVRVQRFGEVCFLARFQPTPAIITYTVYKPHHTWMVLSLRFTNRLEQLSDEATRLLAETDRPSEGFDKARLLDEIAALEVRKQGDRAPPRNARGPSRRGREPFLPKTRHLTDRAG